MALVTICQGWVQADKWPISSQHNDICLPSPWPALGHSPAALNSSQPEFHGVLGSQPGNPHPRISAELGFPVGAPWPPAQHPPLPDPESSDPSQGFMGSRLGS